ncbi:hypothetical protein AUEXF2481DRAFT_288072 [Aureobasidium subglaciale EXF-2481]|uniref:Uncharacterized protein n=1 Tax=Aureobasidium subglaciale (strain EXF-2481) TaxID=1043005 RepID=A0A074YD74_AURSE|nr:uncharacterized protein AUEXF2481DRAFT_288072 [Aureobasidium subglaciale EXF-2481]KEQ93999.1 hypothetical protein AUEXF2481DRAFT_288072 [Aureobasidium subglaciale EXF-2481]
MTRISRSRWCVRWKPGRKVWPTSQSLLVFGPSHGIQATYREHNGHLTIVVSVCGLLLGVAKSGFSARRRGVRIPLFRLHIPSFLRPHVACVEALLTTPILIREEAR